MSLGFFDDIVIAPADLQENSVLYASLRAPWAAARALALTTGKSAGPAAANGARLSDQDEQVWVWNYGPHKLYMDVDEEIRFRVQNEVFVDTMPAAPDGATVVSDAGRKPPVESLRQAPYSVQVCAWSAPACDSPRGRRTLTTRRTCLGPTPTSPCFHAAGLYQPRRPGPFVVVAVVVTCAPRPP